jgi:hypothetical protein
MKATTISPNDPKVRRQVERAERKAHDRFFGKRRSAGEMGRNKTKAAQNKRACRGKISY